MILISEFIPDVNGRCLVLDMVFAIAMGDVVYGFVLFFVGED